ncbi:uncharacterized protein LOC118469439 [Amphiprion ocellaris]|uniref:uncharacterized protein LOC118469439 n=1 Tax=Amphiprion ocellaris TaxID=80972 RepID=UPI001649E804|nr:uncharacterized protein LOC118469439 [Amphiprion ocellaris]XP_035798189.1 uncharacterized protein LOC118469439 [Amphiprion ocellaris]
MGNHVPKEKDMGEKLRCCKCNEVLPPCLSFDDIEVSIVHGRYVYMFNGGEYYQPADSKVYECEYCFNKAISGEEETEREEERRQDVRQQQLNKKLQQSHQQANAQHKKQISSDISDDCRSKQDRLTRHLDEFEPGNELGSDEFLEILSSKCSIPVSNLSLTQLTADQLGQILSVLDKLLFHEWLRNPPSLSTLQHTQVFITELCALSPEMSEEVSLQSNANDVQYMVESISQSAYDFSESFLLTQALYLNMMHFFTDSGTVSEKNTDITDTDAIIIAKQWAEDELSIDKLFPIQFLSNLTSSLQTAVEGTSAFILQMEIQCLKLLLSTLTHLNDKETHSGSSEMILRLVQTNQWTPKEAVTLLKGLSQKYVEDASIVEILKLVQVYDISPEWTDESGRSLIQVLDVVGPEKFYQEFQKALRTEDEKNLDAAPPEIKMLRTLDDSDMIDMIKNIITAVLRYSETAPKDAPLTKASFECVTLNADDIQKFLSHLCKAVFDIKGWWPTVRQMLRWCALIRTEGSGLLQLVGLKEDPCVTAMFVAAQVCMGNKVDFVLSSDLHSKEQIEDWSDFYKYLQISLNTNMNKTKASYKDVYEADIVYGTMDDFVSDYFQHGIEVMETGNPQLSRGFIIQQQSLSASKNLELSRLKENDSLVFAAEVLQKLLGKFQSEDMELRHKFIKALFQVLHTLNKDPNTENKIITISEKIAGKGLTSNEAFILKFLENLLRVLTRETEAERNTTSPAEKWCLEVLFACAEQCQASKEQTKEIFHMVSNLGAQRLWSPVEALNLLGALINHDEDCVSIMKILHLMETYQISAEWTDANNQSLLNLLDSCKTENLIQHIEQRIRKERKKSIDTLFDEIRQMKDIDEETLSKSYNAVTHVTNLIKSGEIANYTDVQRARNLSHSLDTEDLQELLAILCNAVHLQKSKGKWFPRANQMISWCLLALSETGKLLEMGTGEGKSCVIAMFAVLRVLRGEKVDVVSSSSVLCQRDAQKWAELYKYFGITVDTNTNKTNDKDRKECYQKDVVYGTIEAFAADHLRQIFEMKDVRPDRSFHCIIIDEVDFLLLDQGVQLTYLFSPMVSLQHLNIILAMIWSHISQYGFLSTGHQTFVQGPPASFFKAIFDSMDTEETEITNAIDILCLAEESNTVPKGFTEDICESQKDELLQKLKTVSLDAVINFFSEIENYVPYGFSVYTLDDKGLLCLRKCSPYNNPDIPDLKFLVLEGGLCCALYDSEEILIKPIAELISEKIQYTPCTNNKDKISIPGFLKSLIESKVSVWVENAFLAKQLRQGQEYVVENDNVCPVDFRSTGITELNKKWGDGLQQFIEIKHQIKLSTISAVTNYISNVSFFEKYNGKIYGTTGTLGSNTDILFLQDLYPNLSACRMPTFKRRKLFEVKGTVMTSDEEWKSEIKRVVMAQISPNSYSGGRAALVICETINKAKEIHDELQSSIPGEIILYCRSDQDSLSKIRKELLPGDVIVATNLAGRGTNIKVSKEVNSNGGLFVVLSFLSENTRVELQAFGRTARKGEPGSAQIIMSTKHLQQCFSTVLSLDEAKSTRDRLTAEKVNHMMNDVSEMKLREDLFSEYCRTLQDIHKNVDGDDRRAVVAIMNEFWGIWLQTKSSDIEQLKRDELQKSLKADLSVAKSEYETQTSPCASIYHYMKLGNIAMSEKRWDVSTTLFEKAMKQDASWAAIAFYSHAYCTVKQKSADYLNKAKDDLTKALESLKYLSEESMVCLQFVKMSSADSDNTNPTSLEKQLTTKCSMFRCFDKNISEAIQKLNEIQERGTDAMVKKSPIFTLVPTTDEDLQVEAYNLYSQGLKYVFSVGEKPRFSWEGLMVFCLGILQIIGGTLLTAFTFGALAQVGMGLVTEGISDCISGIEAMVTGEFSWKSWAIEKAISIGVSLIGFGVGKVIAKGFKASKMLIKGFRKQLKAMPKFLSSQAKDGLSVVAKTNMKNAVKKTAKKAVKEIISYGLGKAEKAILAKILESLKHKVKKGITDDVISNIEKEPLSTLVDSIVLSHIEDKEQLHDLLENHYRRRELLSIFTELSSTAAKTFTADLMWQNKLNSSFSQVIGRAKAEAKGTVYGILTTIQAVQIGALAGDAIHAVLTLSSKFFSNFHDQLNIFKEGKASSEKVTVNELSASDTEMLKEFKQDVADNISTLLADALVEVFHQKFSSHIISRAQGQVNGIIGQYVRTGLKTDRTEEKLRAGQNNRYISYMQGNLNSKHKLTGKAGQHSQSHAEKIKNPMTEGTILDIRVLAEAKGTKVVILTEDSHGKLTKMQELSPSTEPASQTVTLIYRPKSAQYPAGHYDVQVNNQIVNIVSKDKNCLFHALARGMKPQASEEEIALEANHLRSVEADTLLRQPGQWDSIIKRKEWTDKIRGGDWYLAEGGAPPIKESKKVLKKEVGKIEIYKKWQQYARQNPGMGDVINADHQPPVNSILEAKKLNQNSKLAQAMLEVATKSSPLDPNLIPDVHKHHGRELPTVYVPRETHYEFPSTKSKAFRQCLAETISSDDVVGTSKLTILGSMPRFKLDNTKNFNNFQNTKKSQTRLAILENSFQQHSTKLVQQWFNLLQGKNVMSENDLTTITTWINNKDYNNNNDPHRSQVSNLL